MQTSIGFVERDIGRFNGQLAATGHGVASIYRQIHDYLLNLSGISFCRSQVGAGDHYELNVFANQASQHFEVFSNHRIQIEDLWSQHLLATEARSWRVSAVARLAALAISWAGPRTAG